MDNQPTIKNLHQLCADTKCHIEDLPKMIADTNGWQKRVKKSGKFAQLDDENDDDDILIKTWYIYWYT